jgi:hypothetical protein
MAYMGADTGNKVGFRPYGSTNAQCAATLSGLGQNHPFKPEAWRLHSDGLGEYEFNRPLDPWELFPEHSGLHGLGDLGQGVPECVYLAADGVTVESVDPNSNTTECAANGGVWEIPPAAASPAPAPVSGIPIGSALTYQCTFTATANPLSASFYSVSNVIAAVAANLSSQWGITVSASSGSGTLTGTPTAMLQVKTNAAYGQVSDIKSIIDGAFYNAAGATIMSSSLTLQGTPATNQSLIQQLAAAQAAGDTTTANTILSLLNAAGVTGASATSIETWIENNAMWIGLGVLAMVVLPPLIKKF